MAEEDQRSTLWLMTCIFSGAFVGAMLALIVAIVAASAWLDTITILGFRLGFYLLAQGLLILFVVAAFWYAMRQEQLDRRHGAAEDM